MKELHHLQCLKHQLVTLHWLSKQSLHHLGVGILSGKNPHWVYSGWFSSWYLKKTLIESNGTIVYSLFISLDPKYAWCLWHNFSARAYINSNITMSPRQLTNFRGYLVSTNTPQCRTRHLLQIYPPQWLMAPAKECDHNAICQCYVLPLRLSLETWIFQSYLPSVATGSHRQ